PSSPQIPQPKATSSSVRKSPRLCQPGTSKSVNAESKGSKRRCAEDSKGTNGKNKKQKTRSNEVPSDDETEEELEDQEDPARIQVLALKCTERDCSQMLPSREAF